MIALEVAIRDAAARLSQAGVEAPRREARLLACHLLGQPARRLPPAGTMIDEAALGALVARRAAREPLAFITGTAGFWTLELAVSPATLIPRADSESLIEASLLASHGLRTRTILDLGTGTGCLLLAALSEFPEAFGIGVDLDPEAAALARRNAAACGLQDRAAFLAGSWAGALRPGAGFDLVLSNPPYIETGAIPGLMAEVACHEPHRALDGGDDGLRAYGEILAALPALLAPSGIAVLELGLGQQEAVAALAAAHGLAEAGCHDDLGGVPRALVLRRATPC